MVSPARIGLAALAAVLVYSIAKGSTNDSVRYINVEGRTYRMTRLGGGRFEIATWGVLFTEEPGPPLATFTFGQDGPLAASGNPTLIDLIRTDMNKVPSDLFAPERANCSKPGCFIV